MKRKKLFRVSGFDNANAEILLSHAFNHFDLLDVTHTNNVMHFEKIKEFLNNPKKMVEYDTVFIIGVDISEEIAQDIHMYNDYGEVKFVFINNKVSKELSKYNFVIETESKQSNASTLAKYLILEGHLNDLNPLIDGSITSYTRCITDYINGIENEWVKNLHELFVFYGTEYFISYVTAKFDHYDRFLFSESDKAILFSLEQKKKQYIRSTQVNVKEYSIGKYKVGVVFAEQYISELAKSVHESNTHFDVVAVINMRTGKISYRTIHKHIDCGFIANYFKGGGSREFAASPVQTDAVNALLNTVFS
ncbi:hypothetical protein LAV82_23335 [Bacillus sp. ILBB4]|nr:hypothetical protein [Bacillus sp. ILBB4]